MSRASTVLLASALALAGGCSSASQETLTIVQSSIGPLRVETVAADLETPWSLAFLPAGRMLVTERPGRMRIISADGSLSAPISGLPPVFASGQGGLLDVALDPAFAANQQVYFSYAEPQAGGGRTAVMRARLDTATLALGQQQRIFAQAQTGSGGNHWGSRLAFAGDGKLFVTLGDRYDHRDQARDLSTHFGKVVRIDTDGRAPADNPFIGQGTVLPEIWSYGHRTASKSAATDCPRPNDCPANSISGCAMSARDRTV